MDASRIDGYQTLSRPLPPDKSFLLRRIQELADIGCADQQHNIVFGEFIGDECSGIFGDVHLKAIDSAQVYKVAVYHGDGRVPVLGRFGED